MVFLVSEYLTPYQQRFLASLLQELGLSGAEVGPEGLLELLQRSAAPPSLVVALDEKSVQAVRRCLRYCPHLQVHCPAVPLADLIGPTPNLDLSRASHPERNRLKEVLRECARRAAAVPEMPREVFLSFDLDRLRAWRRDNLAEAAVCRLADGLSVGIYEAVPEGRFPVELTWEELERTARLHALLPARLTAVKDGFGVRRL